MAKEVKKYCPKCGTSAKPSDSYCIKCGYSFTGRTKKNKLNFSAILIVIAILIILWIGVRLYLKKPIIPQEIIDFVNGVIKGFTNKTG